MDFRWISCFHSDYEWIWPDRVQHCPNDWFEMFILLCAQPSGLGFQYFYLIPIAKR